MALARVAWVTNIIRLHLPKKVWLYQSTDKHQVTDKRHKHPLYIHTFMHTCIQHILHNTAVWLCSSVVNLCSLSSL